MSSLSKPSTLQQFEQCSGLTFSYVPEGSYRVGLSPGDKRISIKLGSEEALAAWRYQATFVHTTNVQLPAFWISTDLMRLSHWNALCISPLGRALNRVVPKQEIALYRYNLISNKDGRTIKVKQDRQESDPALTLSYTRASNVAHRFGFSIPTWDQWEVAARGPEAWLFPWGNTMELTELQLQITTYYDSWQDDTSDMGLGFASYTSEGQRYRIISFGRYATTPSPFGLVGLARWGMEWNSAIAPVPTAKQKEWSSTNHVLRSLCDLGIGQLTREYTNDAHRTFSGPVLGAMLHPDHGPSIAAFRLVMPAQQILSSSQESPKTDDSSAA